MADLKLSDQLVVALTCPAGRKDVLFFDSEVRGFGLRVTAAGARVFLYQYRVGPTVRRLRLGTWPALTTHKARKLAETHRGTIHGGGDPVGARREKHAAAAAAEVGRKAQEADDALTFPRLVHEWQEKGVAHRRPRYVQDAGIRLGIYFSAWRDRPASSITRADAIRAIDEVQAKRGTISARRGMAYARACYGWAVRRDLLQANPFQGIAAPGQENPRDRVLSAGEMAAIWQAAGKLGPFHQPFFRLLILTLQRREEVAGMRWSEISPDGLTWTVPATRAKNGRAHLVHLAPAARAILEAVPRMGDNDLVFPGRGDRSISGFSNIKRAVDAEIRQDRQEKGLKPADLPEWRFHDFRRTGVTTLAGLGFAPHVCDRLLNHLTGAIQGVAAVYQRAEFLAERQAALEAWAENVAGSVAIDRGT